MAAPIFRPRVASRPVFGSPRRFSRSPPPPHRRCARSARRYSSVDRAILITQVNEPSPSARALALWLRWHLRDEGERAARRIPAHWRQRVDNPAGRIPTQVCRSARRASSACSSTCFPATPTSCGSRSASSRTRPATARASTAWPSGRSTRRASCCSTTTRGWRSSRASTGRGMRTWTTSSTPARRSRCST